MDESTDVWWTDLPSSLWAATLRLVSTCIMLVMVFDCPPVNRTGVPRKWWVKSDL